MGPKNYIFYEIWEYERPLQNFQGLWVNSVSVLQFEFGQFRLRGEVTYV